MKHVSKRSVRDAAAHRLPGYEAAVLEAAARQDDTHVWLDDADFARIRQQYAVPPAVPVSGPGTELKALLSRVGITATPNCTCNAKARQMDEHGAAWCEEHIEEIVGWLREEAAKRRLPFLDAAGRMLVRRAIRNARRAAAN